MDDLQKIQQKQANLMNENWNHAVDRTNNVEKDFYRMQKESELIDDIKFSELLEENGVEMITRFPTTYLATDKKSIAQYNKDLKEAQKLAKGKKVMVTGHTIRFLKAADRRVENIDKLMVDALGKIEIKEVKEKSDYYEESAEDRTQRILNKIPEEFRTDRERRERVKNILSYSIGKNDKAKDIDRIIKETWIQIDKKEGDLLEEMLFKPINEGNTFSFREMFSERAILTDPEVIVKQLDKFRAAGNIVNRLKHNPFRAKYLKRRKFIYPGHNAEETLDYAIEIFERNSRLCMEAYETVIWEHGLMVDEKTGKVSFRDETTRYDKEKNESIKFRPIDTIVSELGNMDQGSAEFRMADEYYTNKLKDQNLLPIFDLNYGNDKRNAIHEYIVTVAQNPKYLADQNKVNALVTEYDQLISDKQKTHFKIRLADTEYLQMMQSSKIIDIYKKIECAYDEKAEALENAIKHLAEGAVLEEKNIPYLKDYGFIDAVNEKTFMDRYCEELRDDYLSIDKSMIDLVKEKKETIPELNRFGGDYELGIGAMLYGGEHLTEEEIRENEDTEEYFVTVAKILEHRAANHGGIPEGVDLNVFDALKKTMYVKETDKVRVFLKSFDYKTASDILLLANSKKISKLYYSMRVLCKVDRLLKNNVKDVPRVRLFDLVEKEDLADSLLNVMEGLYKKTRAVNIKAVSNNLILDESLLKDEERKEINKHPEINRHRLIRSCADNLIARGNNQINEYDIPEVINPGYTQEEKNSLDQKLNRAHRDINNNKNKVGVKVYSFLRTLLSYIKVTGVSAEEKEEAEQRFNLARNVMVLENSVDEINGEKTESWKKQKPFYGRYTNDVSKLKENTRMLDEDFAETIENLVAYKKTGKDYDKEKTADASISLLTSLAPHYLELAKKYGILNDDKEYEKEYRRTDLVYKFHPEMNYDIEDAELHYQLFCDVCDYKKKNFNFEGPLDLVCYVTFTLQAFAKAQKTARQLIEGGDYRCELARKTLKERNERDFEKKGRDPEEREIETYLAHEEFRELLVKDELFKDKFGARNFPTAEIAYIY